MSEISLKLPVRYDHSSSLLIEADGGPIADCLTNHEVGEQIAAALNATLTEQLAEAQAKNARFEAMLRAAGVIELMSGDCLERDPEFGGNWRLFIEGNGYNPAIFGTAYEAFEATQEKTDG